MFVHNFSRHDFNGDQVVALKQVFGEGVALGQPEAPFFKDVNDLVAKVSGEVASLVVPWDLLMEAIAGQMFAAGTTLIAWRADEAARKRGAFAAKGVTVYDLRVGGAWAKSAQADISPTEEVNFQTGEVAPYPKG